MGKVVKGFIIGACVCIALGVVLFTGAAMAGGFAEAKSIIEKDGYVGVSINNGIIGISSGHNGVWITSKEHIISLEENTIPSLEIELGAGEFEIVEKDITNIVVKSDKDIQTSNSGGHITIQANEDSFWKFLGTNSCDVTIEVPRGTVFDTIALEIGAGVLTCPKITANSLEMEIGAGTIVMDGYQCEEASVSVGAGEVIVNGGNVKNMDIEVGMGNFVFTGAVAHNLDVSCGMGNAELNLDGSQTDYNYSIECGMGNVTVGSSSYAGVGAGQEIDNGAPNDFNLECGMGNLEIRFVE